MSWKCGIIGLPNAGKSSIFNALTAAGAETAIYPFSTINPNLGVVPVPDERLAALGKLLKPEKLTPTTIEFVDVAGLIAGASKGEGLGNQFLGHIRDVDLLVHVVRCFASAQCPHPLGSLDPVRDVGIVDTELLLADLEILGRQKVKLEKKVRMGEKAGAAALAVLSKVEEGLNRGGWAMDLGLTLAELEHLQPVPLLTLKPCLFVANLSEEEFNGGEHYQALQNLAAARNAPLVPILGDLEAEIQELPADEQREFLTGLNLTESGIRRLIRESYRLLKLVTFYTIVGPEVRAWTVPEGTPLPEAAGRIHSDMEKGFIRAEVMNFNDLQTHGSQAKVKEAGRLHVEGRDYHVQDGEILLIRFAR